MNTKKIFLTILLAIVLPASSLVQVRADDTDIYLKPPSVTRDDAPNILIILDNSGSMETNTVNVTTPYDPTTTYTSVGFDTTKVYWSASGTAPTSSTTTDVFSASNNTCASSAANLGSAAGATGYYTDTLVMWHASANPKNWGTMLASTDDLVACKADSPTYGGSGPSNGGAGAYVDATNNSQWTGTASKEISWASYSSVTLYSGNYLNYLNGTTTTVSKTRIEVAREAVTSLVNSNISVRIGLMTYNYNNSSPNGGRVVARIQKLDNAWRTSLDNTISQIRGYVLPGSTFGSGSYETWTPLAETMYEAYKYLSGGSVTYGGANWDTGSVATILSNNGVTDEPRPYPDICAENDSNSAYCAGYDYSTVTDSTINTWYGNVTHGTYISPFKYQCQQAYVIIVTDGDPTKDTAANTAIAALPNMTTYPTPTVGGDTSATSDKLDDLAGWMYNNDLIPNSVLPGTQRVLTYTVGFGNGISASGLDLLKRTADAGHGKYFDASNANNLATSLQSAIIDIQTVSSSFAAPSLSVNAFNKLYNRDDIYFALFKPSSTVEWNGNIKKLHLCNTTDETTYGCTYGEIIDANGNAAIDPANLRIKDTAQSYWSTSADGGYVTQGGTGEAINIQTPSGRNIYTVPDYTTTLPSSGLQVTNDFTSTSGTLYSLINSTATPNYGLLDNTGTISAMTSTAADTAIKSTIDWMVGYDYGSTTTQRWPFSDPLHSRPVAITYGDVGGNTNDPIIKLFMATNDGEIHMIDDSTGKENWAFIPPEMLGNQYTESQDADGNHLYGADASPTFWINDVNGDGIIEPSQGDFVYMYIGMRRGGRNIYCFDVTPPGTLSTAGASFTPKLKWVIRGGVTTGYERLGYTWSAPQVATIRVKCGSCTTTGASTAKTVLIFGGGYNPNQDYGNFTNTPSTDPYGTDNGAVPSGMGNGVYIADPTTGALIWDAGAAITTGTTWTPTLNLPNMIYSIPSDLSLMDSNGDGAIDRIYFGDMGGQVWRIDLDSQLSTGSNGATTGYVFADLNCNWTGTALPYARDCSNTAVTTDQSWRKVFYPPDVAQLSDPTYSSTANYDIVAVATGDRADPVDYQTSNANEEAVNNRIYALRDTDIATGPPATIPKPIIAQDPVDPIGTAPGVGDLVDLTNNPIASTNTTTVNNATTALKASKGWFIDLLEPTAITVNLTGATPATLTTRWVGEKALAKPVIFDHVLYVTTYTPANAVTSTITCSANEGLGKIYALNLLNATATVDLNGDGTLDRVSNVGGGIPSELVTVIRQDGVTGLVGTSGGAASPNIGGTLPRGKSFWYQQ
jgi:type IV pilus assembly protein PilY1